jgi:hypothetical protein
MVGPEGLEPPTLCFEGRCSIQLSYGPVKKFITTRDGCVFVAPAFQPVQPDVQQKSSIWPGVNCSPDGTGFRGPGMASIRPRGSRVC